MGWYGGWTQISFRLRLFRLKMDWGKQFTPCCVFGCAWKIWSNRKLFPLTVKWACLKCKIDYRSILPTNHFWKKKKKKKKKNWTKRESESEREPPTVREREAGNLNLRSTPPPSGPCLSPLIKQRLTPLLICPVSLFLPLPPFATHVTDLPFFSLPMSSKPLQDKRPIVTQLAPPPLDWTQSPLSLPSLN